MSSLLRYAVTPASAAAVPITQRPTAYSPPTKKQKMSLTQTYYVAHTARAKLSKEAARGDHNLRLLVGHANLLDGLMLDLAHAEEEQERWFNQTVHSATKASQEPKQQRVSWAPQHVIVEEEAVEEEMYSDDSESESDEEEGEEEMITMGVAARMVSAQSMQINISEDEDEDMEDDDFDAELSLTRTSSRSAAKPSAVAESSPPELCPPELMHECADCSDSEEDESMPPSPPQTELLVSEKQRPAIIATSSFLQSPPSEPIDGSLYPHHHSERAQVAIAAY